MSEWEKVRIGDFCSISKGNIGITKAIPGEYTLVTTADKRLSHNDYAFSKPAVIIPLVSGTGHGHASINRIHYQDGKFSVGSILCVVTPKDSSKLNANFLYHFLDVFKEELLVRRMRGMANVTLPIKAIAEIEFPLLSIEQQQHWVNLLNRTSQNTANITNELTHQKSLLKKLRQSILQDAVSGKLTELWRKDNPVTESATELLKRIETEKAELVKAGKIKKQKPLPPVKAEEIPFELPESWVWCRLWEVCRIGGGKRVSNGYKLLKEPTNHIYIRVSDMKNGTISDKDLCYIDDIMYEKIKNYIICKDDLYMTIVGATIGKCGIVPEKFNNMNLTENAAKLSFYIINKLYMFNLLNSKFCQDQFIDKTKQVGVQKMALNRFITTIIPLPPFAEQLAIVAKVEALLKHCDQLETEITASEQNSQMLLQTVLKEAFNPA